MPSLDDIEDELDAWLEAEVPVEPGHDDQPLEERPVAPANDSELAEKLLYKMGRLEKEGQALLGLAAARKRQIDAFVEDRMMGIERERERVARSLEGFARNEHRLHPKGGKTIKLPSGQLKLAKSGRGRILIEDEHVLAAWLDANAPDLVTYRPVASKEALHDEKLVTRHAAPTRQEGGELVNCWRLMTHVEADPLSGRAAGDVTIPGVFYVEPANDRFSILLPTEKGTTDE
jgi:hypothetical protein